MDARSQEPAIDIREELAGDVSSIRDLHRRAFAQDEEADIVDALRASGAVLLSIVATLDGVVLGHILYSPASVGDVEGAALGPMAVDPDHQRRGIGSRLVEAGNQRLHEMRCPFIVVVGHAGFYPRFGFVPASAHGITCAWDVPDDVFMAVILDSGRMSGRSGLAVYRPEFPVSG